MLPVGTVSRPAGYRWKEPFTITKQENRITMHGVLERIRVPWYRDPGTIALIIAVLFFIGILVYYA